MVSIKSNAERDPRVALFMRFMGISGQQSLPFSVFQFYLHLIKATNVQVNYIYKHEDPSTITLSYQKVMYGFRELLSQTNAFNRRNVMTQLRNACVITTQNPTISRDLTFNMFETYRYTVERLLKSQHYRSFSDLLNALFEWNVKEVARKRQDKNRAGNTQQKDGRLKRGGS